MMNKIAATLAILLSLSGVYILDLQRALAAKPKVEVRIETRTITKRVAGPVQVREKIVFRADGSKESVEKFTDKAAVATETNKAAETERKEEPACLAPLNRFFGITVDTRSKGVRGGMTILRRIDAAASVKRADDGAILGGGDLSFRF